jgi:NTP pyrophosphatase (non-canonical NTP hydrolase)
MTGSEYQVAALSTLKNHDGQSELTLLLRAALGLCGEAGEVAEHLKKVLEGKREIDRAELLLELGDVLWYVASMCSRLGVTMDEAMEMNIEKLAKRYG